MIILFWQVADGGPMNTGTKVAILWALCLPIVEYPNLIFLYYKISGLSFTPMTITSVP